MSCDKAARKRLVDQFESRYIAVSVAYSILLSNILSGRKFARVQASLAGPQLRQASIFCHLQCNCVCVLGWRAGVGYIKFCVQLV